MAKRASSIALPIAIIFCGLQAKFEAVAQQQGDFYLALSGKALAPVLQTSIGARISKLDCTSLCLNNVNCDAFSFSPPPSAGADAVCQLVTMDLTTNATDSTPWTETWLRRTTSSDLLRNRYFSDQKLYAFVIQYNYGYDFAHTYCPAIGATVASLTSISKHKFYTDVLSEAGYGYVGMRDTAIAGLFVDEHGNTHPPSLNYPGDPGSQGPQEDCLIEWYEASLSKFVTGDSLCSKVGPFICEFPRKDPGIGCFEVPPKPEGAVYQNWDEKSFPLPLGTTINSICPAGERFHTGISVYSTICQSNGYWSRPSGPVPFCTGTPGYVASNTSTACYKLLQDTIVFPSSAEAHCQRYGGQVLPFTIARLPIFREAFSPWPPAGSGQYKDGMVYAGYNDVQMEGTFVDAQGNPIQSSAWGNNEPDGGSYEAYAYLWLDSQWDDVFDSGDYNFAGVICQFSSC